MTAQDHIKVVGILHVLHAFPGIIFAGLLFAAIGGSGLLSGHPIAMAITGILAIVIGSILLCLHVPGLILGIGILMQKNWARVGGLVLGVLYLIEIPFGTALGIYTIYALERPEVIAAFKNEQVPLSVSPFA